MYECAKLNLNMDEVKVYILHISLVKENISFIYPFVDTKRKEKAERYVHEKDQLLSFGAGYLLKKYLPNEEIKITNSGKPYLENGPYFNISHSGDYVLLAVHPKRDVGADIEIINEKKIDGIRYILNEEEKKITDLNTLFLIWSNKESLVKCLSTGIKDMKEVSGLPLDGLRTFKDYEYYSKSMIYEGYSLSVTLKGKEPFDMNIKRVDSLEE